MTAEDVISISVDSSIIQTIFARIREHNPNVVAEDKIEVKAGVQTVRLEPTIMTPDHPRWDEFLHKLTANDNPLPPIRCNGRFWIDDDNEEINEESFAVQTLREMGMDAEQSIEFFESMHAYCDCQILYQVTHEYLGITCVYYMEGDKHLIDWLINHDDNQELLNRGINSEPASQDE
jgi:hypothetical protein